jgi:UDP-glucose 4-epimerase
VPHIVFASSGGTVYGPAREQRPFREDDECRPQSSYGIEKLAVEHYLRMAAEHEWLSATVLRIGNPYGVLLPPERLQGFIGTAISQVRSGRAIRVFGNRANVRDFLFVTDMCRAFDAALVAEDVFDVFNIGTGHGHSVDDVLRLIQELEGRPLPVEIESSAAAQELPSWVVLDVHKAAKRLGWAPEVTLEDGVCRLLAESRRSPR